MVIIDIESIGDERFVRGMNRYVAEMRDFREVFKEILEDFQEINKKNFAASGTPISFTPAMSPAYVEWKRGKVGHNIPMVLYGTLKNSLTGKTEESVADVGKTQAFFSTEVPYANRHYYERNSRAVQLTGSHKANWARMIQVWAYKKWKEKAVAPSYRSTV